MVVAPNAFQSIADRYEAQDPAAFLSLGPDATVVAGYRAQKRALAAALRSRGSAVYNLFLQGKAVKTDWVVYLHPLSRGTVHVDPRNPLFAPPLFDYRALNNPADVDVLVEFTRFTRRFFTTTRLAAYGLVELFPGAHVTAPEDIAAALRARLSPTVFHPVGNAAMMPRALGGVVDDKLQVYGVVGLSIADASVILDMPGATRSRLRMRLPRRLPISSRPGLDAVPFDGRRRGWKELEMMPRLGTTRMVISRKKQNGVKKKKRRKKKERTLYSHS